MKRLAAIAASILAFGLFAAPVSAQQYPSRTVTIICPYPAGGPTDQTARVLANFLTKKFGQNFIVENVTGGGTNIGTNRAVKAAPDGYTMLLHNLQISANPSLYKSLPFDTAKDLTPVMMVNNNPLVLVGRKDLPPNNLTELMAYMKTNRVKAALPGYGATGHLATALVAQEGKVQIDMIPYRGAAPAITDLLGGHVDLFFATPQSIVPQVNAGQLKAYGVTGKDVLDKLPKAESFVKVLGPKLDIIYWQAMYVPSGTPDAIVATINTALQEAVSDPTIIKTWEEEGFWTFPKDKRSVAAAGEMMKSEIARWGQVIRDNNITVEQ